MFRQVKPCVQQEKAMNHGEPAVNSSYGSNELFRMLVRSSEAGKGTGSLGGRDMVIYHRSGR